MYRCIYVYIYIYIPVLPDSACGRRKALWAGAASELLAATPQPTAHLSIYVYTSCRLYIYIYTSLSYPIGLNLRLTSIHVYTSFHIDIPLCLTREGLTYDSPLYILIYINQHIYI